MNNLPITYVLIGTNYGIMELSIMESGRKSHFLFLRTEGDADENRKDGIDEPDERNSYCYRRDIVGEMGENHYCPTAFERHIRCRHRGHKRDDEIV